jgi:hypothetical protein
LVRVPFPGSNAGQSFKDIDFDQMPATMQTILLPSTAGATSQKVDVLYLFPYIAHQLIL